MLRRSVSEWATAEQTLSACSYLAGHSLHFSAVRWVVGHAARQQQGRLPVLHGFVEWTH